MKNVKIFSAVMTVFLLILTLACAQSGDKSSSYAEDRAKIEDLQARYLFALDSFDLDTYVKTFTEDGILDIIDYKVQGREEIKKKMEEARSVFSPSAEDEKPTHPVTSRHNITNIVIKIDGDKAVGRAYWFHYGNNNPERKTVVDSHGHYEDEMKKVNGEWLFSKRVIYNENVPEWISPEGNRAW